MTWAGPAAAAEHLGVSLRTLREWRTAHGLPFYVAPTGGYRYRLAELDEWMRTFKVRRSLRRQARRCPPVVARRLREVADAL